MTTGLLGLWNSGSMIIMGSFLLLEKYWFFLGGWNEDGLGRLAWIPGWLEVDDVWVRDFGKGGNS